MTLDAQLATLLTLLPERDYSLMTVADSRANMRAAAAMRGPVDDGVERIDLVVGGVRVRRYGSTGATQVVYLHGGGWVSGDVETHDAQCGALARATAATVLAVDYRRAPEDPFPSGLDDALTVLRHAAPAGPVAVAGDSAGANLAAAAALVMRDEGLQLLGQLLLYPATDLRGLYSDARGYASRSENASGYLLGMEAMRWFARQYVTEEQAYNPRVSVLLTPDLAAVAPAVIATAEYDPLRDEGIAYAEALASAGVSVQHHQGVGMVHGFCGAVDFSLAAAAETERVHATFAALLRGGAPPAHNVTGS